MKRSIWELLLDSDESDDDAPPAVRPTHGPAVTSTLGATVPSNAAGSARGGDPNDVGDSLMALLNPTVSHTSCATLPSNAAGSAAGGDAGGGIVVGDSLLALWVSLHNLYEHGTPTN